MAPKVVVVGGGMGGAMAAKALEDVAEVTLIDSKEYFEVTWASIRGLVEPKLAEKILWKHNEYLKKATVVVATASGITDSEVTTADGQTFPFDFAVVSTGSMPDSPPLTLAEKIETFKAENGKLKEAKSVLIVGGGPVGVELAGEIVTDLPGTKVTLVHGGTRLLEFVGEKAGSKALKWLQAKGVEVLLHDKIEVTSEQWGSAGTFKTTSGKEISTDYLAVATGRRVNSSWLPESFPLNKSYVKVDAHLRVEGHPKIFAIGDVADLGAKQGYLAMGQALVVVGNIKALIKSGEKAALKTNPKAPDMAMISLGRKDGLAALPFGTFTGWLPTNMKSKGLFISKVRKDLKLPA